MPENALHRFDVRLCRYALDNIRGNLGYPGMATYVADQLDPPIFAHLQALGGDVEPAPLLLIERDLCELASTFAGGPLEFDRPWVAYEPLHRSSIECVREIRAGLAGEYAEEWARASRGFVKQLEDEGTRLGDGIQVVGEWVREVRRLLRAMGPIERQPALGEASAAPSISSPCSLPSRPVGSSEGLNEQKDDSLKVALAETQAMQREVLDLLLHQRTVEDYYTTEEVATMLGKAEFTVREWCRKGRVHAQKQGSGRGKYQAWVIAHEELQRLQREGLLPASRPG